MSDILDARQERMNLIIAKMNRVHTMAEKLSDEDAAEFSDLFPVWSGDGVELEVGQRVSYEGVLYRVLQAHTTQASWTPVDAPSLFSLVIAADNPEVIVDWIQPDSTNGYPKGQLVSHNGLIWESTVDANVWEPGTTGAPWIQKEYEA